MSTPIINTHILGCNGYQGCHHCHQQNWLIKWLSNKSMKQAKNNNEDVPSYNEAQKRRHGGVTVITFKNNSGLGTGFWLGCACHSQHATWNSRNQATLNTHRPNPTCCDSLPSSFSLWNAQFNLDPSIASVFCTKCGVANVRTNVKFFIVTEDPLPGKQGA